MGDQTKVAFTTTCPNGHRPMQVFDRADLEGKLDEGTVRLFCAECVISWEPAAEESRNLKDWIAGSKHADVLLFCYGTLRQPNVQLTVFGRAPDGRVDFLTGYALSPVAITDSGDLATGGRPMHTIARETGNPLDEVSGTVFRITQAELAVADACEVSDCKRVAVRLGSGTEAFLYVDARL